MTLLDIYLWIGIALAVFALWRDFQFYVSTPLMSILVLMGIVFAGPAILGIAAVCMLVVFPLFFEPESTDDR